MKRDTKWREEFEANMLDGDSVYDCGGATLSAEDVYEYVSEYITSLLQQKHEESYKLGFDDGVKSMYK